MTTKFYKICPAAAASCAHRRHAAPGGAVVLRLKTPSSPPSLGAHKSTRKSEMATAAAPASSGAAPIGHIACRLAPFLYALGVRAGGDGGGA